MVPMSRGVDAYVQQVIEGNKVAVKLLAINQHTIPHSITNTFSSGILKDSIPQKERNVND